MSRFHLFSSLIAFAVSVGLALTPNLAVAQHGSSGGGSHGGGGGGGSHSSGGGGGSYGGSHSSGGSYGGYHGAPSGSYGGATRSYRGPGGSRAMGGRAMGRGAMSGRGMTGRGGVSEASRASNVHPAIADGQWHSFGNSASSAHSSGPNSVRTAGTLASSNSTTRVTLQFGSRGNFVGGRFVGNYGWGRGYGWGGRGWGGWGWGGWGWGFGFGNPYWAWGWGWNPWWYGPYWGYGSYWYGPPYAYYPDYSDNWSDDPPYRPDSAPAKGASGSNVTAPNSERPTKSPAKYPTLHSDDGNLDVTGSTSPGDNNSTQQETPQPEAAPDVPAAPSGQSSSLI